MSLALLACAKDEPAGGPPRSVSEDDCQRAVARLIRIDAARAANRPRPAAAYDPLAQCRKGGTAALDPVLRCALDGPTDAAAATGIDAFVHQVLPNPSPPDDPAHHV